MNRDLVIPGRCLGVLLGMLVTASAVRAEVLSMSLAVNGVVCPVCAHSVNMGLRRLEGIKSVKVLMKSRVNLDITPQSGAWVEPVRIFQQISLVGYRARPDEMKLRLRGTISKHGDRVLLTLTDVGPAPVRFLLAPAGLQGKRRAEIDVALQTLEKNSESDGIGIVEAEGFWRRAAAKGMPASLLLTHVPKISKTVAAK